MLGLAPQHRAPFAGARFCSYDVLAALVAGGLGAAYHPLAIASMAIIDGGLWLTARG